MPDPRAETIDQLLLDRVSAATDLPEPSRDLLFAALVGSDELNAVLGGAVPQKPQPPSGETAAGEPIGTYLAGIEVTGFRGIGPPPPSSLKPGPGLTIVTGRNGSGKSSFAEAAESPSPATTSAGPSGQPSGRTAGATCTPTGPADRGAAARRGPPQGRAPSRPLAGRRRPRRRHRFPALAGKPRQSIAELGWAAALKLYRPFLSYAELGGLLGGKPSEITTPCTHPRPRPRSSRSRSSARATPAGKSTDARKAAAQPCRAAGRARRPPGPARPPRRAGARRENSRPRRRSELLGGRRGDRRRRRPRDRCAGSPRCELPERAGLAAQVDALEAPCAQVDGLAGTPAAEARSLAGLLRDALATTQTTPTQPCPVCGGRTLDAAWAEQAGAESARSPSAPSDAERVQRARRETCRALRAPDAVAARRCHRPGWHRRPATLRNAWQRWDAARRTPTTTPKIGRRTRRRSSTNSPRRCGRYATPPSGRCAGAAAGLAARRRAGSATGPTTERAGRRGRDGVHAALKTALAWLQGTGTQIRNERLAPFAGACQRHLGQLRQESNVDLGAMTLAGSEHPRRVDLDVSVDGAPARRWA